MSNLFSQVLNIYDVWYDENQISDGIAERFLKTVAINADPNPPFMPQE